MIEKSNNKIVWWLELIRAVLAIVSGAIGGTVLQ